MKSFTKEVDEMSAAEMIAEIAACLETFDPAANKRYVKHLRQLVAYDEKGRRDDEYFDLYEIAWKCQFTITRDPQRPYAFTLDVATVPLAWVTDDRQFVTGQVFYDQVFSSPGILTECDLRHVLLGLRGDFGTIDHGLKATHRTQAIELVDEAIAADLRLADEQNAHNAGERTVLERILIPNPEWREPVIDMSLPSGQIQRRLLIATLGFDE